MKIATRYLTVKKNVQWGGPPLLQNCTIEGRDLPDCGSINVQQFIVQWGDPPYCTIVRRGDPVASTICIYGRRMWPD